MDSDNILEIGALVNLGELLPGMEKMASSTVAATTAMGEGFKALATTTASSTAQMSTVFLSVPAAAQQIPPAIESVVVATESGTNKMGFNWRGLAGTVKTAALEIVSSVSEIGAKISETAERSRLGIGTMETAFAGLSSILGAGIAVGFAAHFMDESARVVIELRHLQVETGISIETLSGLRAIAQQTAVPFDSLQTAIVRMQRAQVQALEGQTTYTRAFRDLGISVSELKNLNPEQLFFRLAAAIANAHNPQVAMSSAIGVFGRGVYTLIPLLREYGGTLQKASEEAGKHSGITDHAAESAMKWQQMTAQLAQTFQSFMIPVLTAVIPIVKGLQTGFETLATVLITAFEAVGTVIVGLFTGLSRLGPLLADLASGNFSALPEDARKAKDDTVAAFKDGGKEIAANWKALREELQGIWAKPIEVPPPPTPKGPGDLPGKDERLSHWREELDKMRDSQTGFHELSKTEEAAFWKTKLEIAKGNAKLYAQVFHEYITAERAARKESLTEELAGVQQRLNATKAGSAQRVAILQEELAHLKAEGAEETSDYRRVQEELVTAKREQVAEDARLTKQRMDNNRATAALDIDAEAEHQKALLEVQKINIDAEASVHQLSGTKRLALDREIAQQEFDIEYAALNAKLALYEDEPKEFDRIMKQLVTLNDRYAKQIAQNDASQLKERSAQWQRFSAGIANDMSRAVGQMLEGQQRFGRILAQLWNQMVVQFAQMVTKQIVTHAAGEIAKALATQAGQTAQTASVAAGTATRSKIGIIEDIKSIMRAAAVSAAHAFKWAMEVVPFPANLVVAPAAAAGAFVGAASFATLARAEKGALLDKDTLVAAHANEMILPPKLSSGLQSLINVGGFGAPSSLSGGLPASGGAAGGGSVVHHHAVNVGGPRINVTVAGNQSGMKDMHNQIVKTVQTAVRRGALSFEF